MKKYMCSEDQIPMPAYNFDTGGRPLLTKRGRLKTRSPNPRKKVKCPRCGRKLRLRLRECFDWGCFHAFLPPHKMKHWWKKDKKNLKRKIK